MRQREIRLTPGQFGWLMLGVIFTGAAVVQVYLFFATAAWWPAGAALVFLILALGCARGMKESKTATTPVGKAVSSSRDLR